MMVITLIIINVITMRRYLAVFRKCYFKIITNPSFNKGTASELAFSAEAI
jgi:hypothetical protein